MIAHPKLQALSSQIEATLLERGGRPSGDEIAFCCVVHEDKNPSASFNTAKGAWNCLGCGTSGGVIDLGRRLGLDTGPFPPPRTPRPPTPRRIPTPPQRSTFSNAHAQDLWHACSPNPDSDPEAADWLWGRGLLRSVELGMIRFVPEEHSYPGGTQQWYGKGYRVAAALFDHDGTICGVQARSILPDAQPKVRNPFGSSTKGKMFANSDAQRLLRGEEVAKTAMITEGLTDTAALSWLSNLPVVGVPGTKCAMHAIGSWVKGTTLIVAFDNDKQGVEAREATCREAYHQGAARVMDLKWPNGVGDACDALDQFGPTGLAAWLNDTLTGVVS